MKSFAIFFSVCFLFSFSPPQHTVLLRNLWERPTVHVLFEGYTLSFTIKDINRALELLAETGDSTYGLSSGIDTNKDYATELYRGSGMEYRNRVQPLLQNGVVAFLLTAGHAEILNEKGKKLKEVIVDVSDITPGEEEVVVTASDPKNNRMIFWGKMKIELYNKDLGID